MLRAARLIGLLLLSEIGAVGGFAESAGEAASATPLAVGPVFAPAPADWRPPARDDSKLDWLRMTSGEWLRGKLDRVLDGTVEFESKELDDVEIDWVDVAELRSARMHTYRLQRVGAPDDTIVTGTAGVVGGVLRIDTGKQVFEFERGELVSMIAGGLRERDYWSFEVSLGFTARRGNSDQSDLTTYVKLQRQTALTRSFVSYRGSISTVGGSTTADNHRATGQFDYYLTRRLFLTVPSVELYRDPFQNTGLRTTIGLGLGYDVIKQSWLTWNVGCGGSYQSTQLDTAPAGESKSENDAAVLLNTSIELDPTSRIDWDTTYKMQLVVTDFDKTNHNLTSVVSVEVWGPLDLDVTAVWDRIQQPARASDGTRPASDDLRFTIGLGIEF